MKVLAFDLSLKNTGWAYGEIDATGVKIVDFGAISTNPKQTTPKRLETFQKALKELFSGKEVNVVLKEQSFSNINIRATQQIFRVVGVFDLTTCQQELPEAVDIAQSTIKKYIGGSGRASKEAVANQVKELTGIETKSNDESDAIALLLTYYKLNQKEADETCSTPSTKKSKPSGNKEKTKRTTKKSQPKRYDTTATK